MDDFVQLVACSGNHAGLISSIYHALPHQPDRCRLYEGPGPRLCYRVVGARASIQPSCFIQNVVRKNKAARVDGFGEDYYPFSMDGGAATAARESSTAPRARKGYNCSARNRQAGKILHGRRSNTCGQSAR